MFQIMDYRNNIYRQKYDTSVYINVSVCTISVTLEGYGNALV